MTCKEAIEQLHEFLDNELDKGNYLKTKQHIDICQKCCEKFEFEQVLKKAIKDKSPLYKTPQYVTQNIVNQWAELNKDSNAEMAIEESNGGYFKGIFDFFTLKPAHVTMTVLLPITIIGLAAYLTFFRPAEFPTIVKIAAERHDSFVNNNINLDLVSSDSNEIRRHFENLQRSNLAIDVPECNGQEMELLGCKNSILGGKKSAYVGLRGNQNKISFEIVNGSGMNIDKMEQEFYNGRSYYFGRHKGYNVVLWRHGNTLYSMTSTMNRRGLMRVASETIRSYNK
ncbi:MAG: zf-HC2 domain-containing protein [Planctomycetota bacterium]|jgi:mycothiol system anti-sigma-R factor